MKITEKTIQLISGLSLAAMLLMIWIVAPSFFSDFWRVATSGRLQDNVDFIAGFGEWAMVVSFLFDVLINALGFVPSILVSTANGLLFGVFTGVIISWLAETVGVIISFLLMRTILRETAKKIIEKSNSLKKVDEISGKNGFKLMLFLRTIPYFPSGLLTALGAVSSISIRDYMLANLIGKFPSTALEVVVGHDAVLMKEHSGRLMMVIIGATAVYGIIWYVHKRMKKE